MAVADFIPLDEWAQEQWDQHEATWREMGLLDPASELTFRPMLLMLSRMRMMWQGIEEHGVFAPNGRVNGIMEAMLQSSALAGSLMSDNMLVGGGKPVGDAFRALGDVLTEAWDPADDDGANVVQLRPAGVEDSDEP